MPKRLHFIHAFSRRGLFLEVVLTATRHADDGGTDYHCHHQWVGKGTARTEEMREVAQFWIREGWDLVGTYIDKLI